MATHFLPGESHGQRSLMGYGPWGHKEADTTEQISMHAGRLKYLLSAAVIPFAVDLQCVPEFSAVYPC